MDYRNYDNALGRFHSIDRLAELAPSITPYRFAFNNPVYWKDPTGLFETYELAEEHIKNNSLEGAIIFNNSNGTFSINHQYKGTDYVLTMIDGELDISGVMESIEITNSKTSNNSQNKGYFASYFKDYFSYKRPAHANAYSPYIPTNRDIAGGLQTVGNGLAYTGYALTLTGVFAEVGVPLAAIGNGMSTTGLVFDMYLDFKDGNSELGYFKAGTLVSTYFMGRLGVRVAGKTVSKSEGELAKKQMETVIKAQIDFYSGKMIENQQNGNN